MCMESALKEVFNVHRTIVRDLRKELYKAENEKKDLEQRLCDEIKTKVLNGLRAAKKLITAEKCYSCHCPEGHVSQSLVLDLLEKKIQHVEDVLSDISKKISFDQQSQQGNGKVTQVKVPSKTLLPESRSQQQSGSIDDHAAGVGEPGSRAAITVEIQAADNRLQLTRHAGKRRRYTQVEGDDSGRKDKVRLGSSMSLPAAAPELADGGARTTSSASVPQPPDGLQARVRPPACLVSETCPALLQSPSQQAGANVAHTMQVVPETLQLDDEPCSVAGQEDTVAQRTALKDQRESTQARGRSLVTAASAVFRTTRSPASPTSFLSSSGDSSTLKAGRTPSPVFDHAHCTDTSFGGQSPALFDELPNEKNVQKLQFPTRISVSNNDFERLSTNTKDRNKLIKEPITDSSSQTAVDVTLDPNFHGLNDTSTHRVTSPFDVTMDPNYLNESTHLTAPLCDITLDPRFPGQTHTQCTASPYEDSASLSQLRTPPLNDTFDRSTPPYNDTFDRSTPPYNDTFDRVPTRKSSNNFAYQEVVRKQVERRKLQGFSCKECSKYYSAMGLTEAEKAQRMAQCSRHRAKQAPPSTPEHFWSLGFPDTDWQPTAGH